ncbi:MAG: fibrobacter succinogenes major paralogous domain-containing protein [Candidatus Marinimicrobia bacterium]|nr:fibrobacter succinogenes major paralogous domain-containing protein [Candidatus Neomarinimicrobiota bacterium]
MKNIDLKSVIIGVALILISGCSTEPEDVYGCGDNFTDIDGNSYETVLIGNQCWMAENLKVTHYQNGDEIPNITNDSEWGGLSVGAYGIYNNDQTNTEVYGNLYNWYAVDDTRDICPEGWHVPSDEEWIDLEMALGMSYGDAHDTGTRGTDQGSQLAGNVDLWAGGGLENNPAFGSSGFLTFPGGYRYETNGIYCNMGGYGYFWSSTDSSNYAWLRGLFCNYSEVQRNYGNKRLGFSLRCVGD